MKTHQHDAQVICQIVTAKFARFYPEDATQSQIGVVVFARNMQKIPDTRSDAACGVREIRRCQALLDSEPVVACHPEMTIRSRSTHGRTARIHRVRSNPGVA